MADQIDEIGVEVSQEFTATQPSYASPDLPACIVGPLMEIVEAVDDNGELNTGAQPSGHAIAVFTGVPAGSYTAISGAVLELIVNQGAPVSITFPAATLTVSEVAKVINDQGIPGLVAGVTEDASGNPATYIQTARKGSDASIEIGYLTDAAATTAFGVTGGNRFVGLGGSHRSYRAITIRKDDLPDPNGRLSDVKVDWDSVEVYVDPGTGVLRPLSRDTARYRSVTATNAPTVFDDGDGDSSSPILAYPPAVAADLVAAATPLSITGNVDMTLVDYVNDVQGKYLAMSVDGGPAQRIYFDTSVVDSTTFIAAINDVLGAGVAGLSGDFLTITSLIDGGWQSLIHIDQTNSTLALSDIGLSAFDTGAIIDIDISNAGKTTGTEYPIAVGDEVYEASTGTLLGMVSRISSMSGSLMVVLDREFPLTRTFGATYFVAKNVSAPSATRPGAELRIIGTGDGARAVIDPVLFYRPSGGQLPMQGTYAVYVSYKGLRLDVSTAAKNATLIRVGDELELERLYGPISAENPLALGLYAALRAAPGTEVFGLGVEATSESEPMGTTAAYAKALELLENKDVYSAVPLTHDEIVGGLFKVHAEIMSDPKVKGERVVWLNPLRPDRMTDTVIASGQNANVITVPTDNVETGIAVLESMLLAEGFNPALLTEDDGVFIEFQNDPNRYLVSSVSQGTVTINPGPLSYFNDFYADFAGADVFTGQVIDRPFSVKVKGAALANRTDEAVAYTGKAKVYEDRRTRVVVPDTLVMPINGIDTLVPGYYAAAALAGQVSYLPPGQPQSHVILPGFTDVRGSSDYFGSTNLRILSGGGLWVLEKEPGLDVVRTRHQLTTDMTNVKTREASITTQIDYVAKVLRAAVKNYTRGRNITVSVLDELNLVLDGAQEYLVKTKKVVKSLTLGNLVQSTTSPDELELEIIAEVNYPLNKIKIRIFI